MASGSTKKELHKTRSGLRMISVDESKSSPFLISEPPWISDHEIAACEKCGKTFDFLNRRHHCRRCGRIFCDKCTRRKVLLPRMSFIDPVRLCEACALITVKENEFFDKHIKTLTAGANFNVTSSACEDATAERQFQCKLSSSHSSDVREQANGFHSHLHHIAEPLPSLCLILAPSQFVKVTSTPKSFHPSHNSMRVTDSQVNSSNKYLEFQSSQYTHPSIEISHICKVQILATDSNSSGTSLANGITLSYTDGDGNDQSVSLRSRTDSSKKAAGGWVVAMQKGMKLIFESKSCANE